MKRQKFNTQKQLGIILLMLLITSGIVFYNKYVKIQDINIIYDNNKYIEETEKLVQQNNYEAIIETIEINHKPNYNIQLGEQYQSLIWELCNKNNISYELALAISYVESKFDSNAININKNGTKDYSLYQINDVSIEDFKKYAIQYCDLEDENFNVQNPVHNIMAGVGGIVHLNNYYKNKGVGEDELIYYLTGAYNRGKNGFKNYVSRNGYLETSYAKKVLFYKEKLKEENKL